VHRRLRILTFNRHEPYIYELAKTGHEFHVLLVDRPPWGKNWDAKSRPIPPNVKVIGEAELLPSLDMNRYDLLLAQSYDDFELIDGLAKPKILLAHSVAALPGPDGLSRAEALRRLYQEQQLASIPIVYVSQYLARNWGLPGRVILHSLDIRDYEEFSHTGRTPAVLTMSHFFKEREELGYALHCRVVGDDIPYRIVGHNPTLPDSGPAKDWDELRAYYRDYRVYLNTTTWGGSLAMLEAMAAGMSVVTTPRPPGVPYIVRHGYSGYVSDDPNDLRNKIEFLLANPDVAKAMGEKARVHIVQRYATRRFVREWQEVFQEAIALSQVAVTHAVGNLRPIP